MDLITARIGLVMEFVALKSRRPSAGAQGGRGEEKWGAFCFAVARPRVLEFLQVERVAAWSELLVFGRTIMDLLMYP